MNFFFHIFKKQDWIRESNGKLLLNDIADVQIPVLNALVDYLTIVTVSQDEYLSEKKKNTELSRQVNKLKQENDQLCDKAERFEDTSRIAQAHADQRLKQVKVLKNLVSAMTHAHIKEREFLLEEFAGGQVGNIVNHLFGKRIHRERNKRGNNPALFLIFGSRTSEY